MAYENIVRPGRKPDFRTYPDGAIRLKDKNGFAVVFWKEENGRVTVKGFCGQSCKADFYETYRNPERARQRVSEYFTNIAAHKKLVAERRAESLNGHNFKVGDIITNSWGYDQTNVDWYRITKTTHNFVWLRRIAAELTSDGGYGPCGGTCTAHIDTSSDDPSTWGFKDLDLARYPEEKHKASGNSVSMQFGCGTKWTGGAIYTSWGH